jgi:Domain of Unknown Function (DUF1080)
VTSWDFEITSFMRRLVFLLLAFLAACRPSVTDVKPARWALLEGELAAAWQQAGIPEEGKIVVKEGELEIASGAPMTGAKFANWDQAKMPGTNYSIQFEAMRLEGRDIFGMCTFPVSSHEAHATFVIGGWGGTVTGISSLNFLDASENATRAEQAFQNGVWYVVRIEVRPEDLRVWINDRPVVNASIKGKKVSLRAGDIDHCLPFGFATWGTKAKVRRVIIESLP